jgi:hypothetical protein
MGLRLISPCLCGGVAALVISGHRLEGATCEFYLSEPDFWHCLCSCRRLTRKPLEPQGLRRRQLRRHKVRLHNRHPISNRRRRRRRALGCSLAIAAAGAAFTGVAVAVCTVAICAIAVWTVRLGFAEQPGCRRQSSWSHRRTEDQAPPNHR